MIKFINFFNIDYRNVPHDVKEFDYENSNSFGVNVMQAREETNFMFYPTEWDYWRYVSGFELNGDNFIKIKYIGGNLNLSEYNLANDIRIGDNIHVYELKSPTELDVGKYNFGRIMTIKGNITSSVSNVDVAVLKYIDSNTIHVMTSVKLNITEVDTAINGIFYNAPYYKPSDNEYRLSNMDNPTGKTILRQEVRDSNSGNRYPYGVMKILSHTDKTPKNEIIFKDNKIIYFSPLVRHNGNFQFAVLVGVYK